MVQCIIILANRKPKEKKGSIPIARDMALHLHKALVVRQVAINQNQPHGREYNKLEKEFNNLLAVLALSVALSQIAF